MKGFYLYNNRVEIVNDNGTIGTVYFTQNSGKVYYRYKINTISAVKHPGIYLGYDAAGNHFYLHNHYQIGRPSIAYSWDFEKGQAIYLSGERYINPPLMIIQNALNGILRGESYDRLSYNCQTFVNETGNNQRRSEAVEQWSKGIGTGLGAAAIALLIIGLSGE